MRERSLGWAIEARNTRRAVAQYQIKRNPWVLQGVYGDPVLRRRNDPYVRDLEHRPYIYRTRVRAQAVAKAISSWFSEARAVRVEILIRRIPPTEA